MYLLGISEIDNDAGAVLLKDSSVVCGINEERLSRIKTHSGFPYRSIEWILRYSGLSLADIDFIAIAKADPLLTPQRFFRVRELLKNYNYFSKEDPVDFWTKGLNYLVNRFRNIPRSLAMARRMSGEIREWCSQNHCEERVIRVPHHYAHAACAYWASGFETALAVTIDGQGEGVTSRVYWVEAGKFQLVKETLLPHSLGIFYAAVTKALGFIPARHEGKVTGLAAYATPDSKLLSEVRKLAFYREGDFLAPSLYGSYPKILKWVKQYGKEQISAAFQTVLEEVATQYISYYVKKYRARNLVLAGGVLANVKLNQRAHEIEGVENVFIFPHMADGGLGYGAAQIIYRSKSVDLSLNPVKDVYWGPEFSQAEIKQALENSGLNFQSSENIASEIAQLLSENKIVGHFNGRMEFGPRALGNRSILYPATDPGINERLNAQLHRSEFMPFAPATLTEYASGCYRNLEGAKFAAQFMTLTFDCTEKMKRESPAVVHVDGTARPQLISETTNPRFYQILREYHQRTGIPSIVNTSFNMHEEPIVCSPEDAIRSFKEGQLDYLAIGDFLVAKDRSSSVPLELNQAHVEV